MGDDRLSQLPDALKQRILSFLPVKNAILLCRLMRNDSLWTRMSTLDFTCPHRIRDPYDGFARFVDESLAQYCSPTLERFLLHIMYKPDREDKVTNWLKFAINRAVEDLSLVLVPKEICLERYTLPDFVQTSGFVKKLCLSCFRFHDTLGHFEWTSLQHLELKCVEFGSTAMETILRGSPQLQSLILRNFSFQDFKGVINARGHPALKELVIDAYSHGKVSIYASNLRSLTAVGLMSVELVCRVPFLLNVTIAHEAREWAFTNYEELLGCLHPALILTVGIRTMETLSLMKLDRAVSNKTTECYRFPNLSCQVLRIQMRLTEGYIPALFGLMDASPRLEELRITVTKRLAKFNAAGYDLSKLFAEDNPSIKKLKKVKITGFDAGTSAQEYCSEECLLKLVKYLVRSADVLESIDIHHELDSPTSTRERFNDITEKVNKLSQSPTSPAAKVVCHI